MQRLIHTWVRRPHWGLEKNQTPAMAMGYLERPVTIIELLSSRGFNHITPELSSATLRLSGFLFTTTVILIYLGLPKQLTLFNLR